jgi:hypothetical protein
MKLTKTTKLIMLIAFTIIPISSADNELTIRLNQHSHLRLYPGHESTIKYIFESTHIKTLQLEELNEDEGGKKTLIKVDGDEKLISMNVDNSIIQQFKDVKYVDIEGDKLKIKTNSQASSNSSSFQANSQQALDGVYYSHEKLQVIQHAGGIKIDKLKLDLGLLVFNLNSWDDALKIRGHWITQLEILEIAMGFYVKLINLNTSYTNKVDREVKSYIYDEVCLPNQDKTNTALTDIISFSDDLKNKLCNQGDENKNVYVGSRKRRFK